MVVANLGLRVRAAGESLGWFQTDLAKYADINQGQLCFIEIEQTRPKSHGALQALPRDRWRISGSLWRGINSRISLCKTQAGDVTYFVSA